MQASKRETLAYGHWGWKWEIVTRWSVFTRTRQSLVMHADMSAQDEPRMLFPLDFDQRCNPSTPCCSFSVVRVHKADVLGCYCMLLAVPCGALSIGRGGRSRYVCLFALPQSSQDRLRITSCSNPSIVPQHRRFERDCPCYQSTFPLKGMTGVARARRPGLA